MLDFMKAYPFALLVSIGNNREPIATHLPVTVTNDADSIKVQGHMALANGHCKVLEQGNLLIVFSFPHAYISTQHYTEKNRVPTWNYIAVHARGKVKVLSREEDKIDILLKLINQSDPSYLTQWTQLDDTYRNTLLNEIVAFEITVEDLKGSRKLSQDKEEKVRTAIATELLQCPQEAAKCIGTEMQKR